MHPAVVLRRRDWMGAAVVALCGGVPGVAWGTNASVPAKATQTAPAAAAPSAEDTQKRPKAALAPRTLVFPRDAGAHLEFATEWWYLTGAATTERGAASHGFQVTFFRSRVPATQGMRSQLAAKQLLFAHAAITDVQGQRLWHDQRIARWSGQAPGAVATDTAWASLEDTAITLGDWSLRREGAELVARVRGADIALDLRCLQTQPLLLQGDRGLSRKGPDPAQASYYYSRPQLQARGQLQLPSHTVALQAGSLAWMDHEWSNAILDASAVGWDWIGINLQDGGALTAFQLRNAQGAAVWAGGSVRSHGQGSPQLQVFGPGDVAFRPLRVWRSAKGTPYPVEWSVRTPQQSYTVRAVVDNQELDSSTSTGAIYWEGLSELRDSAGRLVGRGYLEMTGYAAPLRI